MNHLRGRDMAMIFQDPMTSLNPVLTIGTQLCEGIALHQHLGRKACQAKALELLKAVGLTSPEKRLNQYPHELSGGMRQRCLIAMALSCSPRLLFADEPTTALDVTTEAQVLDVLKRLQAELGMAVVLISHNLASSPDVPPHLRHVCRRRRRRGDGRRYLLSPGPSLYEGPLGVSAGSIPERQGPDRDSRPGTGLIPHAPGLPLLSALPPGHESLHGSGPAAGRSRAGPLLPVLAGPGRSGKGGIAMTLIEAKHISKDFVVQRDWLGRPKKVLTAVHDLSLTIGEGETVGLVGESGCGKSTFARTLLAYTPRRAALFLIRGKMSLTPPSAAIIAAMSR